MMEAPEGDTAAVDRMHSQNRKAREDKQLFIIFEMFFRKHNSSSETTSKNELHKADLKNKTTRC